MDGRGLSSRASGRRRTRTLVGLSGLAFVSAFIVAAQPARAEVRLSNEAGGNYRIAVMSWWDIPFRSVVRQQYDFSCGSAAVATLLSHHYGRPTPERETFGEMWKTGNREAIRKVGFSMFDMKAYLASIGYRAEGYRLDSKKLAQLSRPSIVLLELKGFKHFVVVKGVRGDRILMGDPMLGLTEYKLADFEKVWNGIALAIVATPDKEQPRFNLAGDWGPWAKAPMEEGGLHVSAAHLTTHLPPSYQLTPQMLLDVRVGTVN
jgi:predicted double-glycine peptidase